MPLWGRNDQAVTVSANVESSTGAPIGTYTAVKLGGGANAHYGNTVGSRANVDVQMFNNATPGAFMSGMAVGVFGVSASEQANNIANNSKERPAHAGWNLRRAGTGPVISIVSNNTLTGYNNADYIVVKSPQAGGNATVTFTTNATGGNLQFTITNSGNGFLLTSIPTSNIFVVNATGGTTTAGNNTTTYLVVTVGGRAGRIHHETLVAMGSLGAQTASYGTPATANDASTDNAYFPGT